MANPGTRVWEPLGGTLDSCTLVSSCSLFPGISPEHIPALVTTGPCPAQSFPPQRGRTQESQQPQRRERELPATASHQPESFC